MNAALSHLDDRLEAAVAHCKTSALADVETMRAELRTWSVGIKTEIQQFADAIRNDGGGGGMQSRLHEGKGTGSGIDKKELAVWKLSEDISKVHFRHWVNAIDIQLEAIHGWKFSKYVLNRVKRSPVEISQGVFEDCLRQAGADVSKDNAIERMAPDDNDYKSAEKTKFLYAYFIGRLNMDLHDRISSIESENGFEVYRQISQILDAVPESSS